MPSSGGQRAQQRDARMEPDPVRCHRSDATSGRDRMGRGDGPPPGRCPRCRAVASAAGTCAGRVRHLSRARQRKWMPARSYRTAGWQRSRARVCAASVRHGENRDRGRALRYSVGLDRPFRSATPTWSGHCHEPERPRRAAVRCRSHRIRCTAGPDPAPGRARRQVPAATPATGRNCTGTFGRLASTGHGLHRTVDQLSAGPSLQLGIRLQDHPVSEHDRRETARTSSGST